MKTFFPRYKWVIFSAVLIIIIVPMVLYTFSPTPTKLSQTKIITSTPTSKIIDFCAPFAKDLAKTSCKEAMKIALEKYPGEVKSIMSETATISAGVVPDVTETKEDVWTLTINLRETKKMHNQEFNSARVFVIKKNGELQLNSLMSGRL